MHLQVTEANSALAVVAGTPTGAADAAALAVAGSFFFDLLV